MRRATLAIVAAAAAAGAASTYSADPEARLAALVAGRTAGQPVSCITQTRDQRVHTVEHLAQVYDAGAIRYVNRFEPSGCQQLTTDTIAVSRTPTDRLCEGDIIELQSTPAPSIPVGSCTLGKFTPYARGR